MSTKLILSVAAVSIVALLVMNGCGDSDKPDHDHSDGHHDTSATHESHDHGSQEPHENKGETAIKPYLLDKCLVSGEKLGEMGEPVVMGHEEQEIKFCCKGCVKDFKKEPEKVPRDPPAGRPQGREVGLR